MKSPWMAPMLALVVALAGVVRCGAQDPAPVAKIAPPPTPAAFGSGDPPDSAEVAADALIVRPVGLAATVVGAAIYVVALPFAAISGDVKTPARSLITAPANFTFKRRLGDFNQRTP